MDSACCADLIVALLLMTSVRLRGTHHSIWSQAICSLSSKWNPSLQGHCAYFEGSASQKG